jgi:predicted transcriptional regulator
LKETERSDYAEFLVLLKFSQGASSRRKILETLSLSSKNCSQIAMQIKLSWHTTSRHLQILSNEGLVKEESLGQRTFFRLTSKGKEVVVNLQGS